MTGVIKAKPQVIVCCGGGVDSTALIHYYLQRDFLVRGIHFDYGQPSCLGEQNAVSSIAQHFGISIVTARMEPLITHLLEDMVVGRNALLVLSAINYFHQRNGLVALGIHIGTEYYDCTPQFVGHLQHIIDGYLAGGIQLDNPFIDFTKSDILTYCKTWGVPVELTYSCIRNSIVACGECSSCLERQEHGLD